MLRQQPDDLTHGRDLKTGADADQEITLFTVLLHETLVERVGQHLPKEGYIRLHDAGLAELELLLLGARVLAVPLLLPGIAAPPALAFPACCSSLVG
jgi:hypothetical protein